MKYYVVGKAHYDEEGNILDSLTTQTYWELGWEVAVMHTLIKEYFKDGKVTNEDTIVTRRDAKFMYESVFKNVIDYQQFLKQKTDTDKVTELIQTAYSIRRNPRYFNPITKMYYRFEELKDLLTNMNILDVGYLHENNRYSCINVRHKNIDPANRHLPDDYVKSMINKLLQTYPKIFMVKFNNWKKYASDRVIPVTLQEYVSLLNNELCDYVIGSSSGIDHFNPLMSKAKTCITLCNFAENDLRTVEYDIVGMARCIRYSPSEFKYFRYADGILDRMFTEKSEV